MKKFLLLLMAFCVSLVVFANDKLSARTQVFLQQRVNAVSVNPALKHYPLAKAKTENGKEYIECFIMLDGASVSELEAMGVEVNGRYNKFVTAKIPVNQIERVSEMKGVKQVGVAKKKQHFTDQAANVTNALKAWDGTNYGLLEAYTGKDVVVGLVDIGIEFNHRAFKDANGNTRVKRVYLPNASSANGGSRPSINGTTLSGYHYTTASQIASLTTDYTEESHGTHTSGCATGSKVGNYSGMAPECDIVLCGLGNGGDDATILNCAKYIAAYAKSVGKPCVISISLGGLIGPHDGNSEICVGYDEIAQEYGAIILLAAGNEADINCYATKTLSSNNDEMVVYPSLMSNINGYSLAHWSGFYNSTSDELKINMMVVNRNGQVQAQTGPLSSASYASNSSFLSNYFNSLVQSGEDYGGISWAGAVDPNSGKYYVELDAFVGSAKTTGNKLVFVVTGSAGNVITAWCDAQYSQFATSASISGHTLTPGQMINTMSDDVCGSKTISVGAMASRLTVPMQNGASSYTFDNDPYGEGDVVTWSSYGTDYNGVNHPFITAPGHSVVSSINRYDTYNYYSGNYNNTGNSYAMPFNYCAYYTTSNGVTDYWDSMSGTSMATPISAGVVALYLQADPTLDVDGVKDVIANTATAYTNPRSPAMQRGHGIINAVAGIEYIEDHANPVPRISVDPTELTFSTGVGQSSTKTFTVSGRNLEGRVNLTLNDPSGVFTLSQAYINQSTLANGDREVSVTFNGQNEGNFTGSVTLTSTNAESKTVTLTASAHDGGTASDAYLDIANYSTIGEAGTGWNASYVNNLYIYTEDASEGVAWLTMPVYGAWSSIYYSPKYQKWINTNYTSSPGNDAMGTGSWNATDVYLGSNSYFTSTTARYFGNQSNRATSTKTITFYVTNTTAVKLYGLNNYYGGNNGRQPIPDANRCSMAITECQDNNGTLTLLSSTTQTVYGGTGRNSTINITSPELNPEKIYQVVLSTRYTQLDEIGFCTPLPFPETPVIVNADPTTTTADITWTPGENNDSWNLRYRPYVDSALANNFWDFEDTNQLEDWGIYDMDGDGYTWSYANNDGQVSHSGTGVLTSASYANGTALTPNDWLVSPKVRLGGSLSFWAAGQDPDWAAEVFQVYICTNDDYQYTTDFTEIFSDITATETMTEYTFDLSSYDGYGYIAIVHHNCSDKFRLNIDDFKVTVPGGIDQPAWSRVNDVTSPYTITGLTPETTYEVQVMGENEYYYGYWTPSTIFITLGEIVTASLAEIEGAGTIGATYRISDELVAVYADADAGLLWCKDQGNASINPSTILDGQIDFMNDTNITGTTGQCGRDWDQSNWIVLKFPVADQVNSVDDLLEAAIGKKIKAGTVTGRYIDNSNYTIEVQPADGNYTLIYDGTLEYTPNVYCAANFLESNLNIGGNTGAVGVHGDRYFFMNPKIQEICEITYAMWDGEMFITPSNTEIPGAINVDWSLNSTGGVKPDLIEGKTYRFMAIVSRPAKLSTLMGGGTPSDNYVVYPSNLTGDGNIVTAINGVYTDGYHGEVIGVEYVNSLGVVSNRPFSGVNIVVTRYSDGTASSVKKVFK